MSVYKSANGKTYRYDFQYRGARFFGNTHQTAKREARAVEHKKRAEAKELFARTQFSSESVLRFKEAASRWHFEVGQYLKNEDTTVKDLNWLKTQIGPGTGLHEITNNTVAQLVNKRRMEKRWGKGDRTVSNATVNRTVLIPLRRIILRARRVWGVQTSRIDFAAHFLEEPQERVREATIGEEKDILSNLAPGYDDAVKFAFATGCRRMEILGMEWTHVDFFSNRFTVTGKYGKSRTLPMSEDVRELLWKQQEHHPRKVWTYVAQRALPKRKLVKGERYPMTEAGLRTAFRRAAKSAEVENFRFHDTRHTAATRLLRESNLRVVQDILGHSDPKTTTKYAHATDDDLRQAIDRAGKKSRFLFEDTETT